MRTIVNRRNALLGWAAWALGKRLARRRMRRGSGWLRSHAPAVGFIASAATLAVGVVAALAGRRRRSSYAALPGTGV